MSSTGTNQQIKLGDILLKYHLITTEQLEHALAEQKQNRQRLGAILLKNGWVTEDDINFILSQQLDIPYVQLSMDMIDKSLVHSIPVEIMERYQVIPLIRVEEQLTVVMADPTDNEAINDLATITHCNIQPALAKPSTIRHILEVIFGPIKTTSADKMIPDLESKTENTMDFFKKQLEQAMAVHATEIHFEPTDVIVRIRYRIDGQMILKDPLSIEAYQPFLTRLKILFHFDLTHQNAPHSGIIPFEWNDKTINIESAIIPSTYGETLTIRIRQPAESPIRLSELSLPIDLVNQIKTIFQKTGGLFLISSPIEQLRIQLAYALLQDSQVAQRKIITVEKTWTIANKEYIQLAIDTTPGLTIEESFKHACNQGGDIILVDMSMDTNLFPLIFQAAVRQKLIIGLLSFRNSHEVISCLKESGIAQFLPRYYLLGILAASQLHELCPSCRQTISEEGKQGKSKTKVKSKTFYNRGAGCVDCHHRGYLGTLNLYELFLTSPQVKKLISAETDIDKIIQTAMKDGFKPMINKALDMSQEGMLSMDEIYQNIGELE